MKLILGPVEQANLVPEVIPQYPEEHEYDVSQSQNYTSQTDARENLSCVRIHLFEHVGSLPIATNVATALAKCRPELQRYMASPIH